MGRNNQQRRAAKARARAHAGRSFTIGARPVSGASVEDKVDSWLMRAMDDLALGMTSRVEASCAELCALAASPAGRRVVTRTLAARLTTAVTGLWRRGWRPAEVHRLLARRAGAGAVALVGDAMATELARYPPSTIAPSWLAQLDDVAASVWWSADTTFLSARALRDGDGLSEVVPAAVAALEALLTLPELPILDPLPGEWRPRSRTADAVDERILERVRALLAKAESTTYEAEAETFTAGAQSLMARHSIDTAMLAAASPRRAGDVPAGRRVGIDRPYEAPKVLLLDAVARANRCRTVWSKELGFVTLVGFETDMHAVETLFTSLLVQATRSATAAGARRYRGGQSWTRSFRTSFLTAFAERIGERLQRATDDETAAAQARSVSGQDLVHVLAERSDEIDARVEELFPALVAKPLTAPSDAEGWHAGRRAADAATLFGEGMLSAR